MARGPRRQRQARRGHRQRRQRDADRPGHRRRGRRSDHLPAHAAVGRAVREVPAADRRRRPVPAADVPALPGLVLAQALLAVRRQGPRLAAEGSRLAAPGARGQRPQRRPPRVLHRVHQGRARRSDGPVRQGAADLPAVRQADPARQRLVRDAAPAERDPGDRGGRGGDPDRGGHRVRRVRTTPTCSSGRPGSRPRASCPRSRSSAATA